MCKKKVNATLDGGTISADGDVFPLAGADKRLCLTDVLTGLIPDDRDPAQITHSMAEMPRERIFAISCGHPGTYELKHPRKGPAFRMACGRLSESDVDLASQPTMSRPENAPDPRVDPGDEQCFPEVRISDADTGDCLQTILRSSKKPDRKEVRTHPRRLVRRARRQ
jgi:hypothetical protein